LHQKSRRACREMSLSAVLPRSVVRLHVAEFLVTADLSQLQALSVIARSTFEDANAWLESASAALPKFELCRDLFGAACRAEFMKLFKTYLGAAVADGCKVPLETMDEARKMAKLLGNAQRAAAGHVAKGGSLAQVLVGRLAFDRNTINAAFEETLNPENGHAALDLCLGTTVALPIAGRRHRTAPLRLHFAWQGGSLLVSARDDKMPSASIEMPRDHHSIYRGFPDEGSRRRKPLTLDVVSLSPALTLNHRGVAVHKNSTWQLAASGIFAVTKGKEAARRALTRGVLCIISVRDGMPEHSSYLAKALHLDMPQC